MAALNATKPIKIANYTIGVDHPPFVIAEMSGNHNQSLDRALSIVDAAAATGAHALKLQTYTPDTMTLDLKQGEFFISDPSSPWSGRSLYDLYKEAHTPWDWHGPLFERCKKHDMIYLSTPFDLSSVDFLEQFNPPVYKIASFENTDVPLIRRVAQTGKPLIISTGMASLEDLELMVKTARSHGSGEVILLKCTSSYPSTPENSHLKTIPHLRELFGTEVGLSDHTLGVGVACASIAMGATVVEKHFTLSRADGGVDAAFSLEPAEMKLLVEETRRAWESLGSVHYSLLEIEKKSMVFRRSLYVAEDVQEGELLTEKNVRCIRPGYGLAPRYYDWVMGKRASQALKRGTPMKLDFVV